MTRKIKYILLMACIVIIGFDIDLWFYTRPNVYEGTLVNCVYIEVESVDGEHWSGSGVIINDKLVTAGHIVEDADYFKIIRNDGTIIEGEFEYYQESETDLGIIDCGIRRTGVDIDTTVNLGDIVFVVGCPFGEDLANNITKGIISKLGVNPIIFGKHQIMNIDAPVFPGNSGGGVFDSDGDLIGIVVGGRAGGISLCIPSTIIKLVIKKYEAIKSLENCP